MKKTPYNTSQTARHSIALLFVLIITLVLPVLALYRHQRHPALQREELPQHSPSKAATACSDVPIVQGGSFQQGCGWWAACERLPNWHVLNPSGAWQGEGQLGWESQLNSASMRRFTNVIVFVLTFCCHSWCSAIISFTLEFHTFQAHPDSDLLLPFQI